jgi:hypothetical protein
MKETEPLLLYLCLIREKKLLSTSLLSYLVSYSKGDLFLDAGSM